MDKELLNKIRVISTSKDSRDNFIWPEECWVVGASNCNFGPDEFRAAHLYHPKWSSHTHNSFGGYTLYNEKIDEYSCWWTFNYVSGKIDTRYLYICDDKETAYELEKFLNTFPSKNIDLTIFDISKIEYEIEKLNNQINWLKESKDIVKLIKDKVEYGKDIVG